jgi:hypothetical protein
MGATLYILRQQQDHISPSLFRESDTDMDIVYVEHATSITLSSVKGAVVSIEGLMVNDSSQTLMYDDLVEKIFSSQHVIVI